MSPADRRLAEVVLDHITDIANARCLLSEADIAAEEDPTLREILAALLILAEELEFREHERAEAERRNLELSTPMLELGRQVLLLPLIGIVDLGRSEQMVERALSAVASKRARVLVIDVTGLAEFDLDVAARVTATIRAVRLLGARSVLTGISPANAQVLVRLGTDLGGVLTRSTLGDGLETAFALAEGY